MSLMTADEVTRRRTETPSLSGIWYCLVGVGEPTTKNNMRMMQREQGIVAWVISGKGAGKAKVILSSEWSRISGLSQRCKRGPSDAMQSQLT